MSGGSAFWIKGASIDDDALAARLGAWRDRFAEDHSEFLRVENDDEPPRDLMSSVSRALETEIIWLSMQSTVDAFELLHYRNGTLIRELVYSCENERTWDRVSGTRQSWEPWASEPIVGDTDPMPDPWIVIEHYGLQGQRPSSAKSRSKSKSAPKSQPKRTSSGSRG